jgi:hypothetical protein
VQLHDGAVFRDRQFLFVRRVFPNHPPPLFDLFVMVLL